jgi:hypothetical protein
MKFFAVFVLMFAGLVPCHADTTTVSVQQNPFDGTWGFGFFPGAFGLLLFPGPYQLTFQTNPSFQLNSFVDGTLDVIEMSYDPGGTVNVLGPNGFDLSGTFSEAVAETFTSTIALPGGLPVGSVVETGVSGAFTGSLTDGEQWQGTFGVETDFCCNEQAPSFLQMMSVPEPGTLLLLCAGMFGLTLYRRRVATKLSGK